MTRDPVLDGHIRAFIFDGAPGISSYQKCAADKWFYGSSGGWQGILPPTPLFFVIDIDREDLLQELPLYYPEILSSRYEGISPIWYVMRRKRADYLRCILHHRPKGLARHLCSGALETCARLLSEDGHETGQDPAPELCGGPDLHEIAADLADDVVHHRPKGLVALLDALVQDYDLVWAIQNNSPQVARYVLSRGMGLWDLSKAMLQAHSENHIVLAGILEQYGAIKEKHAVARMLRNQLFDTAARLIEARYEVTGSYFIEQGTALHYAVQYGRIEIVQSLLLRGAEVNVCNRDGLRPGDIAANLKQWDMLALLRAREIGTQLPNLFGCKGEEGPVQA